MSHERESLALLMDDGRNDTPWFVGARQSEYLHMVNAWLDHATTMLWGGLR